ncbi:MAG: hypothetical protein J6Q41_02390 [Firmicutes bacterium]|nr:hypothetical protein [Bacillota bacterium]
MAKHDLKAKNIDKKKRQLHLTEDGKHVDVFLIFAICFVVILLSVGQLILPDRKMSDNENRYLTQAPKFDVTDILEGKFESQLEEYLADQIPGRENWIKIMSTLSTSIGMTDVNGVYILKDGRLIERKTEADFNARRFRNNLENVAEFQKEVSEGGTEVRMLLVPTAAYSYREEFNASTNFDEVAAMDQAKEVLGDTLIDFRDDLMPDKEGSRGYYYLTDHHWNYDGAEKGARAYMESIGKKLQDFNPEKLSDDFMGTLYSKILLTERVRDRIEIPEESKDIKVKVTIEDEKYDSIYFMDRLEKKDKYEVFFGGNYDRVDIVNKEEGAKNKPKLMIVKDSYANSFVPFILGDFREITLIDTRYYRESVKDLALDGEYDDVLVLYSIPNFSEEKLNLNESMIQ